MHIASNFFIEPFWCGLEDLIDGGALGGEGNFIDPCDGENRFLSFRGNVASELGAFSKGSSRVKMVPFPGSAVTNLSVNTSYVSSDDCEVGVFSFLAVRTEGGNFGREEPVVFVSSLLKFLEGIVEFTF